MPQTFPLLVAVLEGGAALVCLYQRQWLMAVVWSGYTVASLALAFIRA